MIIHAATDASAELNKSNPELMHSTIMDGTKRICEFAEKVHCKRILYTSSGAAYGPQPEGLTHMSESFVNNPLFNHNDAYANAKLESEKYFKENAPCEVVIARCFAFAGPYLPLNGSYAFGNFLDDALHDRDIVIKGDGCAVRSYLYSADLVIWLLRILSAGKDQEIYNVGSSLAISIKDLAKKIGTNKIHILASQDGKNKNVYIPSLDKITMDLGLRETFTIDEIIYKTKSFYKCSK